MILSCERCDAQYTVGDDSLGDSGRKVRCTSCGHIWFQKPDFGKAERANPLISDEFAAAEPRRPAPAAASAARSSVTAAADSAEPAVPVRRFGAPARKPAIVAATKPKGRFRKRIFAIAALALPSAALASGLFVFRDPLVTLWPPIARLYTTVGIPISAATPDLAIRSVRMEEKLTDGHRTLLVDGEVANVGAQPRALPPLRATLGDGAGKVRWSFSAGPAILAPGEASSFHTQLPDAPESGRTVTVGLWR